MSKFTIEIDTNMDPERFLGWLQIECCTDLLSRPHAHEVPIVSSARVVVADWVRPVVAAEAIERADALGRRECTDDEVAEVDALLREHLTDVDPYWMGWRFFKEQRAKRRGPALFPYQQAWAEDRSRFKVWDCDRRLGATTGVIAEALAVADDPEGGSVIIVQLSFRDAAEVASDIEARGHKVTRWEEHFAVTSTAWPIVISWHGAEGNLYSIKRALEVGRPLGKFGQPPELIVFDNFKPSFAAHDTLTECLDKLAEDCLRARRVALVATGFRESPDRGVWEQLLELAEAEPEVTVHVTTARDAIAQGLGKRWCEVNDREWSPEWEAEWIESIRQSDPESLAWRL